MKKTYLSNHKAIILAGGLGTRLYPITKEMPKPLLLIKRKPIINYAINLFQRYGIKEIAILIDKNFREDFWWWKERYYPKQKFKIVEEEKPLGTFGGLWYLKNWLSYSPFFLANGDGLHKVNLVKMNDFHNKFKTPATIALVKARNSKDYGAVLLEKALIKKFLERSKKLHTNYISSGLYLLSPEIFDYHPGPKFSMIEKELFPKLARERKLAGVKVNVKWIDCGTWERYEEALRKWR